MVVKEKRGRRRYILFRMDHNPRSKEAFVSFLRSNLDTRGYIPYVIQCKDDLVIVRCQPGERDEAIQAMESLGGRSLLTSGTLRKLRTRYGL